MLNRRVIILLCLLFSSCVEKSTPPFHGTIFIDPDIITHNDSSAYIGLEYIGKEDRTMYDRRVDDWIIDMPFLFSASYNDSLVIEVQVNSEFQNINNARKYAEKYSVVIGRLSTSLRYDVETVWIHRGMELFGGGNRNILIHTDYSEKHYEKQGILEETLVHEASHTSLDSNHSNNPHWLEAQKRDNIFISNYAMENPEREDIAESYLPYLAIRYRENRITDSLKNIIIHTIPNRIEYFDSQNFKMHPIQ